MRICRLCPFPDIPRRRPGPNPPFRLLNITSTPGLKEVATTLRSVARIEQFAIDSAIPTLTITGTADQIALAEWLVPRMDVATGVPNVQEYRVAGNSSDVLLVYGLQHAPAAYNVQEIFTNLRTVADVQRLYQLTEPRILVMRGDASHVAMAEFLLPQLDQPAQTRQNPAVQEYPVTANETLAVYGLAHTTSQQSVQEMLTTVRTVLDVMFIYQDTAPWILDFRASPDTVKTAEWLLSQRRPRLLSRAPEHRPGSNRSPENNPHHLLHAEGVHANRPAQ